MRIHIPAAALLLTLSAVAVQAQSVDFGNDNSQYSNDGECDDRRFIGDGMATDLDTDDNFGDATDCRRLYEAGRIKLVSASRGQAATQCKKIKFGIDGGDYSNDGECDDPRFDGPGVDAIILLEDLGKDATDCRAACTAGKAWLRVPQK